MFDQEEIDRFNQDVKDWTEEVREGAVEELNRLGVKHYDRSNNKLPLQKAVKTRQRQRNGLTYKTSFVIPRSSVFLHKGVGRDTPIEMVGKTNRQPKPWLNPIINKEFHKLQNIVANHQGNLVIKAIIIR